ncbi:uncharacterized protein EV154DRAFT_532357 [Mucor mucedo]|uniref:Uncharacterized protein n=1 Tax=Mucor saturninus TaxID=64648 RepID=A0A8H7QN89_9FUNG|nr:uncharacterized protein EV154DRAFT_532357 [Mucor mucedo]KAG2194641.1 hypothetical protein INT47_002325 [Mucor saturninus]KAI7866952.1 hypothetical protein EV154DRAFT_532357 [Mucor mucedo]
MITARYNNFYSHGKKNDISCRRFTLDERKNWTTDESGDEQTRFHDKDRFIELAQAALEEAKMEEEQKGVLQELVEALIARTGAPMMADVILEQFRSQDVIERLAEDHFNEQQKRRRSSSELLSKDGLYSPHVLKEPTTEQTIVHHTGDHNSIDKMLLISEYLWRLFRLLLLSSLVCLVYHFMCADPNQSLFKF